MPVPHTTPPVQQLIPVPKKYQSMYGNLMSLMDRYDTSLTARDTGKRYPVIFATELLPANVNRGEDLLKPQAMQGANSYLDRLEEMSVQGVTIPISWPILSPSFPRNSEYLAFYKLVVQEVRKRSMKVDVENWVILQTSNSHQLT